MRIISLVKGGPTIEKIKIAKSGPLIIKRPKGKEKREIDARLAAYQAAKGAIT